MYFVREWSDFCGRGLTGLGAWLRILRTRLIATNSSTESLPTLEHLPTALVLMHRGGGFSPRRTCLVQVLPLPAAPEVITLVAHSPFLKLWQGFGHLIECLIPWCSYLHAKHQLSIAS